MFFWIFLFPSVFFGKTQASCGGVIRSRSGTITSPGFPNDYPNNQLCKWEIIVPPQEKIKLTFTDFTLESQCVDYVEVYSRLPGGGDKQHGRFCGTSIPPAITSEAYHLNVTFRSDNSNTFRGFKATFQAFSTWTKNAQQWLQERIKKRKVLDLPRATLALHFADLSFFLSGSAIELKYSIPIRILAHFSRNVTIGSQDLALYVQALMVTCQDPRHFYGFDLVEMLRTSVDRTQTFTNPFAILALCNAGARVTERDVERVSAAFFSQNRPFWTDIQAIATMAMQCLSKRVSVDPRIIADMQNELKKRQFQNGTVESLVTTALVIQALRYNNSFQNFFDYNAAFSSLTSAQDADGSWGGSVRNSFYVLPAISESSFLDINAEHCPKIIKNEDESLNRLQEAIGDKFVVQYSVWIGGDVDLGRTWRVRVQSNKTTTFYDVLEMVSKLDNRHNVTYQIVDGKPYVRALQGKEDDPEMGVFWFTYVRSTSSKAEPLKLLESSPADIKVIPNQELILWYKSNDWSSSNP